MYKKQIERLIKDSILEIDTKIFLENHPPTMASSQFLTNKEQGDWAEDIVLRSINEFSEEYVAIRYGRSDDLSAGDEGFSDFFENYQKELNTIGKKPDLLIFKKTDFDNGLNLKNSESVKKAIAAIEIRSSSFLIEKYNAFMRSMSHKAITNCLSVKNKILEKPYCDLLRNKSKPIYDLISEADENSFKDLTYRMPSWRSTKQLSHLCDLLRELKEYIKILHKRDYLSITPKVEDIALVNRWIQNFGVKHYYLQVFFDKAYVISFKEILELIKDSAGEETNFSIEKDVKNQNKTTVKINVSVGKEIIGKIDAPKHESSRKELERGRLLFYVKFKNGRGYLDKEIFEEDIING